jgi:ABC-type Fe3+ transport system permease subunit
MSTQLDDRTGVNMVPVSTAKRPQRAHGRFPWPWVIPALIVAALFTLGPLVVIVVFSFMSRPPQGGGVIYEFTLEPYVNFLFQTDFLGNTTFDPRYLSVFGDSLMQGAITTIVCLLLAFPIALWIATRPEKMQNMLVLLITIPFWTNLLVRTYAWMLILNDNGIVNSGLNLFGLPKLELLYTPMASQLHLPAVHGAADLRLARRIRLPARRGGVRPRSAQVDRGAAHHPAPRDTGHRLRRAAGVHAGVRLVRAAGAARRRQGAPHRQPDRLAVRRLPQLAVRRGALGDHPHRAHDRAHRDRALLPDFRE